MVCFSEAFLRAGCRVGEANAAHVFVLHGHALLLLTQLFLQVARGVVVVREVLHPVRVQGLVAFGARHLPARQLAHAEEMEPATARPTCADAK